MPTDWRTRSSSRTTYPSSNSAVAARSAASSASSVAIRARAPSPRRAGPSSLEPASHAAPVRSQRPPVPRARSLRGALDRLRGSHSSQSAGGAGHDGSGSPASRRPPPGRGLRPARRWVEHGSSLTTFVSLPHRRERDGAGFFERAAPRCVSVAAGDDGREVEAHEGVSLGGNGDERDIGLEAGRWINCLGTNLKRDATGRAHAGRLRTLHEGSATQPGGQLLRSGPSSPSLTAASL